MCVCLPVCLPLFEFDGWELKKVDLEKPNRPLHPTPRPCAPPSTVPPHLCLCVVGV